MLLSDDTHTDVWSRVLALSERDPHAAVEHALHQRIRSVGAPPTDWKLAFALGVAYQRAERIRDAATVLQEAETGLEQMGDTVLALRARHLLAVMDQHSPERPLLERLEPIAEQLAPLDALESARVTFDIASEYNRTFEHDQANALLLQIEPLVMGQGRPFDRGRLQRLLGVVATWKNQPDAAMRYFHHALGIYEALGNRAEIARTLFQQVTLHTHAERFPEAERELARAHAIFTEQRMPIEEAHCHYQASIIQMRLGNYDRAIKALQQARQAYIAYNRSEMVANCDLELGNVVSLTGLHELADHLYQQAYAVYEQLGRTPMMCGVLRNMGNVERGRKRYDAAHQKYERAYHLASSAWEDANLLLARGSLQRLMGLPNDVPFGSAPHGEHTVALQEAAAMIQRASALFAQQEIAASVGECQLELAKIAICLHQPEGVPDLLYHAQRDLTEQRWILADVYYTQGRYRELQAHFHARAGQPEEHDRWQRSALVSYRQAIDVVYRLRQRLLLEQASSGILHDNRHIFAAAYRLACACDDPYAVLRIAEQQNSVALTSRLWQLSPDVPPAIRQELDQVSHRISTLLDRKRGDDELQQAMNQYFAVLFQSRHSAPIQEPKDTIADLDELRNQYRALFGTEWTILLYVTTSDTALMVLVLTDDDLRLHDISQSQKLTRVQDLGSSTIIEYLLTPTARYGATDPWQRLSAFGEALIPDDVRARLHANHRLLIVPGGMTNHIPWAALRVNGRWLVEQAVIQMIPSLYSWQHLLRRAEEPAPDEALLAAVSTFAQADTLRNTQATLDVAETMLPMPITRLPEQQVTTATLRAMSEHGTLLRYGLIHLATHGSIGVHGELAHLLLSDEPLFADDIARLKLAPALVLLLTCEGGTSHNLHGGEVLSLNRAFLVAGAADVIANQGFIYDETVLDVLKPLYAHLLAGHDAPTALALAQRERATALPSSWAGFVALGAGTRRMTDH